MRTFTAKYIMLGKTNLSEVFMQCEYIKQIISAPLSFVKKPVKYNTCAQEIDC